MKRPVHTLPFVFFYLLVFALFLLGVMGGSKAVTTMTESTPKPNRHCIVIDAGHGGEDGGAISCTGVLESEINLSIALRLEDLLHLLGFRTQMIRTTNTAVYTGGTTIAQKKISDLKERVRIVNSRENAILLSIHQNHFTDGAYHGAQVFYSGGDASMQLAELMQTNFAASVNPGSRRQCKKASGVYLMEQIQCTGVLVECGFLSNAVEENQLRTPAYQQRICCVIGATLSQFLAS